jgi:hypothetical protein
VHAISGLRAALPASARSKQGTRRYEEARKRQERASCAPGWLACAVANDAEILPSQSEAEDRHSTMPDERESKIAPEQNVHHDSRTVQQSHRDYCIPVFVKAYGLDVAM